MTATGSEITVERADDWETLQRLLHRGSWDETIDRHRSTEVFRGHENREYTLRTSLQRFVGDTGKWGLEVHLLRNFNKYAQQYIDEPPTVQHLVSLAQHHGLPTRLLDWSYSPLVAVFFSTLADPESDGEVLAVDYERAHEHLPDPARAVLDRVDTGVFDIDLLGAMEQYLLGNADSPGEVRIRPGSVQALRIPELLRVMVEEHPEPFAIFYEPPPIDQRIANQSSLFASWYPDDPTRPMEDWLAEHPEFFRRIVIPAERKREFRDRLDQANVNHRTLFPGLDGLARWLADYYEPVDPE
jgi:hypothetical protein